MACVRYYQLNLNATSGQGLLHQNYCFSNTRYGFLHYGAVKSRVVAKSLLSRHKKALEIVQNRHINQIMLPAMLFKTPTILIAALASVLAAGCTSSPQPFVQPAVVENISHTTDGSFCTVGTKTWIGGMVESPNSPQHAIGKCKHPKWDKSDVIVLYFGDDGAQASEEYLNDELDIAANPSEYITSNEVISEIATVDCQEGSECKLDEELLKKGALVHFAVDADVPLDQNEVILVERIAKVVKRKGGKLFVIGHTDNTATNAHNIPLALRRAETVRKILVAQGVESSNIIAGGRASASPMASNDNPEGRALNRRTEVYEKAEENKERVVHN